MNIILKNVNIRKESNVYAISIIFLVEEKKKKEKKKQSFLNFKSTSWLHCKTLQMVRSVKMQA